MANKKFCSFGLISFMSVLCLAGCQHGGSNTDSSSGSSNSSGSNTQVTGGATGAYNYLAKSYDERADILGQLESYALKNHLTGIPLFDDGGEGIYSSRLEFPTANYVPGYGWGVLREGNILNNRITDSDDKTGKYSWYLHYMQDENPTTINGDDSQDTVGSEYDGYAHTGLFGTRLKTDANGKYLEEYEWYPILAKSMPEVDTSIEGNLIEGGDGYQDLASTFKVYIKTGEDGINYSTLSTNSKFSKYNGQGVAPEDYEWAMRMLLSGDIGYYRASQYIDSTPIKGASNYYNVSQQYGWYSKQADEAWKEVGYHVLHDDGGYYIQITYQIPTNMFYAMYQMTSFTTPVPEQFFCDVCGFDESNPATANYDAYGNVSGNLTPVDTYLSIGPYTVETWNTQDGIFTFKRNDDWFECQEGAYKIKGIKYKTNSSIKSDTDAVIKAYFDNQVDSASVTSNYYDKAHSAEYSSLVRKTPGATTWKWNVNSCDQETWEELFGTTGSITQTPASNYWNLKPAMSNDAFLNGLFVASDRQAIAKKTHSNAAFEYFTDEYLSDPENGVIYNDTQAHQDAIADFYPDTLGYDKSAAQALFNKAIDELIADGSYKDGDKIVISAYQMLQSEIDNWGSLWEKGVEEIFNTCTEAQAHNITLDIQQEAVTNQMDVYNLHLQVGQFDLCMGSISGSTLDPLGFMEVLKSDNSSGFTLNWGTDTSVTTDEIQYDGHYWSFDALWSAACEGAIVENGAMAIPYVYIPGSGKRTTITLDDGDHPAIQLSFNVNADLAAEAGIDLTTDEDGTPVGITAVNIAASVYNPDSTFKDDSGTSVYTFSFSSSADKISYDSSTKTMTVWIALDLAYDFTSASTDTSKQEEYKTLFIQYFQNATSDYPISFRADFEQSMNINDVPSTGTASDIFTTGIVA